MGDENERLAEAVQILIDYLLQNVPATLLAGQTTCTSEPNGIITIDHEQHEFSGSPYTPAGTVQSPWPETDRANIGELQARGGEFSKASMGEMTRI